MTDAAPPRLRTISGVLLIVGGIVVVPGWGSPLLVVTGLVLVFAPVLRFTAVPVIGGVYLRLRPSVDEAWADLALADGEVLLLSLWRVSPADVEQLKVA